MKLGNRTGTWGYVIGSYVIGGAALISSSCGSSQATRPTTPVRNTSTSSRPGARLVPIRRPTPAEAQERPGIEAPKAVTGSRTPLPAKPGREEKRTAEVIRQVVHQHRHSVRDCYDGELAKRAPHDRPQGTLVLRFKLSPRGEVQAVALVPERSDLTQQSLVTCASAAVRSMPFPPSSRGFESTVNYPFNFRP